jgi:hypothetical protein
LPLLQRAQDAVINALDHAHVLVPFPILGLDTDNGGEFLNAELFGWCERAGVSFTRGRVARKNDQCVVEQKNGSGVPSGPRFVGEVAYRPLAELYRAVRLDVTFFEPSMRLAAKRREGSTVRRSYDRARTPLERLLAANVLDASTQVRVEDIAQALDGVPSGPRLLRQIATVQEALWRHAVLGTPSTPTDASLGPTVRFCLDANVVGSATPGAATEALVSDLAGEARGQRRYRRTRTLKGPRTDRTRVDLFAGVWEEVEHWLVSHPESTAKAAFLELQRRYPGRFPSGQVRPLQRRLQEWRAHTLLTFADQWLREEVLAGARLPPPLQAVAAGPPGGPRR